jgi:hypothetical protein
MVVLPIVNMLLMLLGFVTPWRKKRPGTAREATQDSTASQARIGQFNEVIQEG